jgi:hypothetical protein
MSATLLNIIALLIPVIMTVLSGFIIPLIKAKIGQEKLATIVKWVTYAVKGAEMIYFGETGKGLDKKEYVIKFINDLFNKKKTVITKEQIEVLLESAVAELNKSKLQEG